MMKSAWALERDTLWRWISVRMIGLAIVALLLVGGGMWLRFIWWDAQLRDALPEAVRQELEALEAMPGEHRERLRQIYGEYLYGDYFAPEVVRADLLFFTGLVVIALPLVVLGGLWVSQRLSRQLGAVAVSANEIAQGDFGSRATIILHTPPALHQLTADFNHMAERLERYDRELQESSAAIAHELRTPLTAAIGRLQGIIDGVFPAEPGQHRIIMRQLAQLNRLLDDLYLLSMASAGRLELFPSEFILRTLCEERLNWAAPALQEQEMQVSLDVPCDLAMQADRDRIGQLLSILIDNALRYAAAGKHLALTARQQAGQVVLHVEDDGPGFRPEHIERACERFWRAEHSRSRHAGGSGLGLSIAAAICAAHGGRLSVRNRREQGASLCVRLPLPLLSPANGNHRDSRTPFINS